MIKLNIERITPRIYTFVAFLVFTNASLYSQQDSLSNYLRHAVRNNPAVQQKFTEYRAALQKVTPAGSLPDPELNLSYYLLPMELVNGRQIADASLMQMFPWFGVLKNAKDEMSNMAMAKFEEYRETSLQVIYNVQNLWYELYRVRKAAEFTERNIEILQGIQDIALIRYRSAPAGSSAAAPASPVRKSQTSTSASGNSSSGMTGMQKGSSVSMNTSAARQSMPTQDAGMNSSEGSGLAGLYRIRLEAADLENSIVSLKDEEQTLAAQFNLLLDKPGDDPVFTADTLITDTLAVNIVQTDSIINSPMLGMIAYEKKSFEAREKMTRGMGLPMVGLGLGYSVIGRAEMSESTMSGGDMVMPMISVTLPVWRKKYKAMRDEAAILAESSSQRYRSVSNELISGHYEAVRLYNDALRRINLYREQHILASNTLELMLTSFSVSSAGLTDILRVRQQLLDYELSELEAITDFNKAVALLKRIMAINLTDVGLNKK